tara:strand:- start:362 stop:802 length:441 start_codon:yes stop_codon:yes gene_type:complete
MDKKTCCCKHDIAKEDVKKKSCKSDSAFFVALVTGLLPHFFCCLMPIMFTVFVGGSFAMIFHDFWFVVTAVVATAASFVIYKLRKQSINFLHMGGNVVAALVVAFVFNFAFHPEHKSVYAASDTNTDVASLVVSANDHGHGHRHDH